MSPTNSASSSCSPSGTFRRLTSAIGTRTAAALTRTIASLGSSIRGSATSRTASRLTSSKTTAFTSPALLLVDELGRNRLGQVHQLVRGLDVAHDRGEVALQLQLALHHPL